MNKYELSQIVQHRELNSILDETIQQLLHAENLTLSQKLVNFDTHETYAGELSNIISRLQVMNDKVSNNLYEWELSAIEKMRR